MRYVRDVADACPQSESLDRPKQVRGTEETIRLRVFEAFETHRRIIDWEKDFSPILLPVKAICVDAMGRGLMKFALKSWSRVAFMNRFACGTFVPGLSCAAHFVIRFRNKVATPVAPEVLIRAGQAMQRFWLTATAEGLVLQPSFAALVFSAYATHPIANLPFIKPSVALAARLEVYAGVEAQQIAFMGRIGTPHNQRITTRSLCRPLVDLIRD